MKKAFLVGIILVVFVIGAVSILSINAMFLTDDSKSTNNPEKEKEPIAIGRNLSVELEEKMGFATP